MQFRAELTSEPIPPLHPFATKPSPTAGALVEFRGVVRNSEDGHPIAGLFYEAYARMAQPELLRLLTELNAKWKIESGWVTHRIGAVMAGETSIYVGLRSSHRAEGFLALAEYMDRLKQEVPIWKTRTLPVLT
jgi:molybdopterin synthase catalytic subunit